MKKKTKGFIAGAAGVGLLMSGTTLALWNDSAGVDDATITSGVLDVNVGERLCEDISSDRTDNSHSIDLAEFKIIPGDTIECSWDVDLALEGENMAARLQLLKDNEPIQDVMDLVDGELVPGLDAVVTIERGSTTFPTSTFDPTGDGFVLYSYDNGNPPAVDTFVLPTKEYNDVIVTVQVTFDEATSDQNLQEVAANLAASQLTLTQVRDGAEGYAAP